MDRLREYLATHTGIVLAENKNYLIESRLKNILTESHLPSTDDLLRFLENHPGSSMLDDVVDAITTHETSWFRDSIFFDYIRQNFLPALLQAPSWNRSIEVWSAASSSGQEAYSFSVVVEQCLKHIHPGMQAVPPVNILGTDISKHVIRRAKSGVYTHAELSRGLSDDYRRQYFDNMSDGSAIVKNAVRQRTRFLVHNLKDDYRMLGNFDIVMCRNVLIYFDEKTVETILRKIHGVLRKNGVLFLGATEHMHGLQDIYAHEPTPAGIMYRAL